MARARAGQSRSEASRSEAGPVSQVSQLSQFSRLGRAAARRLLAHRPSAGLPAPQQTPHGGVRLVPSPVFVLSYMRSGSTLLRTVLNSHPEICAPHEMHLALIKVEPDGRLARMAMEQAGYRPRMLENMMWDRVLYDQLVRSGKSVIVDKTPSNTVRWQRIVNYWPQARLIVLRRHPVRIMESWVAAHPDLDREQAAGQLEKWALELTRAEQEHAASTLSLRYEDFTRDPAAHSRELCRFLGVPFAPEMIDYGRQDHGSFTRGLGDWSEKIQSGTIQAAPPDPAAHEVPEYLRAACEAMGYR